MSDRYFENDEYLFLFGNGNIELLAKVGKSLVRKQTFIPENRKSTIKKYPVTRELNCFITVRFMISRNDEKLNKNLFFFSGGAWSKMTTIRSLKEAHIFSRIKLDKATTNYWHCTLFTFSLHGAHSCDTWSASPAHEFFILMRWPLWCFPLDNNVESSNTSISLEVSKRVILSKQWKIS